MPQGVRQFVGRRLTEARLARGITSSRALADLIGRAPSTVGRWEDGESLPEPSALLALSSSLRLPAEYFLEAPREPVGTVFFRSFAAAVKASRALQSMRLLWLTDVAAVAEHYAHLPTVDVPDLLHGRSYRELRAEDLERAANELRQHWGLALRPIDNVLSLLEQKGVIIACEVMDTDRLDGLSTWSADGRPFMLLANDKDSYARRQFDAAHELAHLVLHRGVSEADLAANLKQIEDQANGFAAAFLLPADQFPIEVQTKDLYEFERLKVRWKVSIKAQIYRLKTLSVLSDEAAASLFKRYSAKGYAKGEPYDGGAWDLQKPLLLADIFRALVDQSVLTKDELLTEFCLGANDVESLSGLPEGWFAQQPARVIHLKPRTGQPGTDDHPPAQVIRLERK